MPLPFIMAAAAAPAVTSLWTILFGSIGISAVTTPTILVGSEYLFLSQKGSSRHTRTAEKSFVKHTNGKKEQKDILQ